MSFEMISLIISISSLFCLLFFILRKLSVLSELQTDAGEIAGGKPLFGLKNIPGLKSFSLDLFLQKIISQMRILTLKADSKTFNWLKNLREKNQKKKLENENYWEEIKNSTHDAK
ncbi:MAG: hypothetical protein V1756_00100 [Patescibacteria group bacterium]